MKLAYGALIADARMMTGVVCKCSAFMCMKNHALPISLDYSTVTLFARFLG